MITINAMVTVEDMLDCYSDYEELLLTEQHFQEVVNQVRIQCNGQNSISVDMIERVINMTLEKLGHSFDYEVKSWV